MKSRSKIAITAGLAIALIFSLNASGRSAETKSQNKKSLASFDGTAITEDQVRLEAASQLESLELQRLIAKAENQRKEHEILEDALQQLLEEKLLTAESAKRGISKEQLLDKEVRQTIKEPTDQEIDLFYEANRGRISKSKEEAATQIKKYLTRQREQSARDAFLKKLEKDHQIVRSFEPLRFSFKETADLPAQGPKSASVVLVLFSDFQCPYCKDFNETIKEVMKNYGTKVRLIFRQFPLKAIHPDAQKAAEASLCANAQNRFWEMQDALFEIQKDLKEENIKKQAKLLGLNMETFNACLASSRYKAAVMEDVRAGSNAGTDGTPTLFINGRYLNEDRSYEGIAAIIEEELIKKK
jgi:predicted DsbA family dithiol-disulfide isomerase